MVYLPTVLLLSCLLLATLHLLRYDNRQVRGRLGHALLGPPGEGAPGPCPPWGPRSA